MMPDEQVDRLAAAARVELRRKLEPAPPDIERVAQRARARRRGLASAFAALVLVAISVPLALRDGDGPSQVVAGPSPDGSNADLLGPGEARSLAPSPLTGRSTLAAVWTGEQMIIWGGGSPSGQFGDGAEYDPRTDAWVLLPPAPLSPRNGPAAVWTGEEVLLWGGSSAAGGYPDGAAYDPTTRRWRTIPEGPFASGGPSVGIWTGTEMIVLAGVNSQLAAAYDPATDRWRTLPDLPGQLQAPNPVAVWAGDRVVAVVVDPRGTTPGTAPELVSLALDEAAWSTMRDLDTGQTVLGWTGDELLVATGGQAIGIREGDTRVIADAPADIRVGDTPSVWTGTELLLWEGDLASAIDPAARTWQSIPSGDRTRRTQPAAVWADGVLLAWGGFPDHAGGVMLRPPRADPTTTTGG